MAAMENALRRGVLGNACVYGHRPALSTAKCRLPTGGVESIRRASYTFITCLHAEPTCARVTDKRAAENPNGGDPNVITRARPEAHRACLLLFNWPGTETRLPSQSLLSSVTGRLQWPTAIEWLLARLGHDMPLSNTALTSPHNSTDPTSKP